VHYCTHEGKSVSGEEERKAADVSEGAAPTTSPSGPREASDPRIQRSRALIVDAASSRFLAHGYLAASLDEVAREAGVSKRTIYNLYRDKEQLFRDVLDEAVRTAEEFSVNVVRDLGTSGGDDVDGELRSTAVGLARAVLGGRVVPLRRLLIGEAARFPELAHDYYERAPARVMAALAEALGRFHERGLLDVDDPGVAAEHFAFLVIGASLDRALFDPAGLPASDEDVESRAHAGVGAFLRAYGAVGRPGRRRGR
jgi:TetR/AcrR family transcriptional regulator, mexJK operon transcriptional repressor